MLPRGVAGLAWMWLSPWTPVEHVEEAGGDEDAPPPLPSHVQRDQTVADGYGPILHRTFRTCVVDARLTARELIDLLAEDMNRAMVAGVARFDRVDGSSRAMLVGDELVVRMPGPWDGPVRVVARDDTSFRLATLSGHLEAGQIEFAARPVGEALEFSITTWARAGDRLSDLLYNHLGVAKEVQFQLWVHACVRAAHLAEGRAPDGVKVRTRALPWSQGLERGLVSDSADDV